MIEDVDLLALFTHACLSSGKGADEAIEVACETLDLFRDLEDGEEELQD